MAVVLIIDDNRLVRESLRRVLAHAGHTVQTAEDGEVGLRLFAEEKFDVVISDVFMPNEDGIGVISKIRSQDPDICIIAISGSGSGMIGPSGGTRFAGGFDALRMTKEIGANYVLHKPIANADLTDAIEEAVAKRGKPKDDPATTP